MKIFSYRCQKCGKKFVVADSHKRKYCSLSCFGKVNGKKTVKKLLSYCKKNKKGFWDSKVCSMGGKKGCVKSHITNKQHKTGFWDKRIQSMGGKAGWRKSHKINKRNKTGIYGLTFEQRSKIGKRNGAMVAKNMKKNGTGFYDPKVRMLGLIFGKKARTKSCSAIGKLYGVKTIKLLRERNERPTYKGVKFDSKSEVLLCKKFVQKYVWYPIRDKNVHRLIGCKEFDFLVRNTFIDYHPFDLKKTLKEYYVERRKVLDENGYKDYHYIVLSSLKRLDILKLNMEGVI